MGKDKWALKVVVLWNFSRVRHFIKSDESMSFISKFKNIIFVVPSLYRWYVVDQGQEQQAEGLHQGLLLRG